MPLYFITAYDENHKQFVFFDYPHFENMFYNPLCILIESQKVVQTTG